jgi:hypothetical protein
MCKILKKGGPFGDVHLYIQVELQVGFLVLLGTPTKNHF